MGFVNPKMGYIHPKIGLKSTSNFKAEGLGLPAEKAAVKAFRTKFATRNRNDRFCPEADIS